MYIRLLLDLIYVTELLLIELLISSQCIILLLCDHVIHLVCNLKESQKHCREPFQCVCVCVVRALASSVIQSMRATALSWQPPSFRDNRITFTSCLLDYDLITMSAGPVSCVGQ